MSLEAKLDPNIVLTSCDKAINVPFPPSVMVTRIGAPLKATASLTSLPLLKSDPRLHSPLDSC